MLERRRLDEAIQATRSIQTELDDTVELIEMAEAEGDEELVDDGVKALETLANRADKDKVAALLERAGPSTRAHFMGSADLHRPVA